MDTEEKFIYIMISSTATKIGKMTRFLTRSKFSHSAISFTEDMTDLWSFSRVNYRLSFVSGPMHEYRYCYTVGKKSTAYVIIFKIPVTEEAYEKGRARLAEILSDSEYAYNLASAAWFWLRRGVKRYKAYTCAEFVSHMLRLMRPDLALNVPDHKATPAKLYEKLEPFEFYSGDIREYDGFYGEGDGSDYLKKFGFFERQKITWKRLWTRYLHFKKS